MKRIETERLILRNWKEETDLEPLVTYYADEKAVRFVGGVKNQEEAWRLMASYIGHFHVRGYSYWAVEEKSTGNFAGAVGIWNSAFWPEPELGFWLITEKQGLGYATEAAEKCLDYALNQLNIKSLVSYINQHNSASIKVALKLGAKFDGECQLLNFGPHAIYRYK